MQAQALIGTMLGTYSLQEFVGRGSISAVFLAQEAQSSQQVAVKVLWSAPASGAQAQPAGRQTVFLERFRRELAAVSSLHHENILPVFEYGEHEGLAYMVMPYISGGTLREVMEQEGPLPMSRTASYLGQLAAALDYAHERGIVHRDCKPSNVLVTPEGQLLLADFGLMKIVAERQTSQMRLLKASMSLEALAYMAPEQIMGDVIDARTDVYALGAILYQMVTGKLPFQAATPLEMATQLVQTSPLSPRSLRADLPLAAEQVILRAMAKRSQDRYTRAQDFASAFRVALTAAGILTESSTSEKSAADSPGATPLATPRPRGLFDPVWQKTEQRPLLGNEVRDETTGTLPQVLDPVSPFPATHMTASLSLPKSDLGTANTDAMTSAKQAVQQPQTPYTTAQTTGALLIPTSDHGNTGTYTLTGAVKVVQVPVAGQPGRYVTGLLPVLTPPAETQPSEEQPATPDKGEKALFTTPQKVLALIVLVMVVLGGSGILWFLHSQTNLPSKNGVQVERLTPDIQAMQAARATATVAANTILIDPLSQNIHNWPVATAGDKLYVFKDGAYHITDNDAKQSAPAILADVILKGPVAYTLTMEEIRGDDSSINNSFGMILRLNSQTSGNKNIVTFYCFEVVNTRGGQYQFWRYDNSKGLAANPWKAVWQHAFGSEFRQGQGPGHSNTIKVFADGNAFTFTVNGKVVGTAHDSSLSSGEVGMLVNLKGTEVAFSNLMLTNS